MLMCVCGKDFPPASLPTDSAVMRIGQSYQLFINFYQFYMVGRENIGAIVTKQPLGDSVLSGEKK